MIKLEQTKLMEHRNQKKKIEDMLLTLKELSFELQTLKELGYEKESMKGVEPEFNPDLREVLKLVENMLPHSDKTVGLFRHIRTLIEYYDNLKNPNFVNGLDVAPKGESGELINFRTLKDFSKPVYGIKLFRMYDGEGSYSYKIGFVEYTNDNDGEIRLCFGNDGKIGVGTFSPRTNLEVKGTLGAETKIGTYKISSVPADGKWHDLLRNLDDYSAFEVMAQVGKPKTGRHALLHALALSTFGRSKNIIKTTQAWYKWWWWWSKIKMRWAGDTHDYKLQIKTKSNYGEGVKINFHITQLWSSEINNIIKDDK